MSLTAWFFNDRFMEHTYQVVWKGRAIGLLKNITGDMWYIDGTWMPYDDDQASVFASLLPEAGVRERLTDPGRLLPVVLAETHGDHNLYCLAFVLLDGILGLRQLTAAEALDQFFPDR